MIEAPIPQLAEAFAYPARVLADEDPAGRWVRLACQRFLDDYQRTLRPGAEWRFDPDLARRPIEFCELMVNVKGPLARRRVRLLPFQKWMLANLFGFVDRAGHRRFRQASVWEPKGNGKTSLCAMLALCCTFVENEFGAEGYSAASTRGQARITFNLAKEMANRSARFRRREGIAVHAHAISQASTGSSFTTVSSDAKSLDGLNVHIAVLDEIGSHRSSAVYDAIVTACGKRAQPLLISISTATANTTGVGRQLWNYTELVLSGRVKDERFFGVLYAADKDDDPFAEATWKKANPAWGHMVQPDHIRSMARQARASPALQAAFKTRHLNVWVSAQYALFDQGAWDRCADPSLKLEDFQGRPCYAGLDMASRTDIAAGALIFPEIIEGKTRYTVFVKSWLPQSGVDRERNPLYVQWAEAGALTVTEGETTDFQAVEDWVRETADEFDLRQCGYDPWQLKQMSQRLRNDGLPLFEYRSSTINFSEPTKLLDALILEGRIRHNGDPVLAWAISNVVGNYDVRNNVYPQNEIKEHKIDPVIATIMALGVSIADEKDEGGFIYTDRSLMIW